MIPVPHTLESVIVTNSKMAYGLLSENQNSCIDYKIYFSFNKV